MERGGERGRERGERERGEGERVGERGGRERGEGERGEREGESTATARETICMSSGRQTGTLSLNVCLETIEGECDDGWRKIMYVYPSS